MTVFDSTNMSEEGSLYRMQNIIEHICETINVNITAVKFMYANYDGIYELTCDFGNKSVLQNDLKKHILKIDDNITALFFQNPIAKLHRTAIQPLSLYAYNLPTSLNFYL